MKLTINIPDEHAYYLLGDMQIGLLKSAAGYRSGRATEATDHETIADYIKTLEGVADQIAERRPRSPEVAMKPVDITAIPSAAADQWREQFGNRHATFEIWNGGAYISAHDAGNRLYHWWPGVSQWQGPECKP